jgi:hypothetical protein
MKSKNVPNCWKKQKVQLRESKNDIVTVKITGNRKDGAKGEEVKS